MKKTRRQFTPQEKVKILRLHLLEHKPVSNLCDQYGMHPTVFYRWPKVFFGNLCFINLRYFTRTGRGLPSALGRPRSVVGMIL